LTSCEAWQRLAKLPDSTDAPPPDVRTICRNLAWRVLIPTLAVSAALAACGGDDDGDGGGADAANLPQPPSGQATVGGEFTKDGEPQAKEDVSLAVGGKTRAKTKTDSAGRFVFEGVAPGSYTVGSGITTPIETGQTIECSVPGYNSFSLTGTTESGGQVAITSLTSKPFDVGAGDRTVKDIVVTCDGS
jgi:hypothetical protein